MKEKATHMGEKGDNFVFFLVWGLLLDGASVSGRPLLLQEGAHRAQLCV